MIGRSTRPAFIQQATATAAHISAPTPVSTTASDLLLPSAVADRLSITTKVLERWRAEGKGPVVVRFTRKCLRYRAADVDAFIAGKVCAGSAMEAS
jgi:hypothetical protein